MVKYPIGIQNFEKLRSEGYVYVDKTPRQLLIFMVLIALLFPIGSWAKPNSVGDAATAKAKVMVVTTMDGKSTKLGLKNTPIITIETPYLVYKSDVAEARFELDQLRDIKYEDVTPISGDASGDGVINRADVDETVQYIFGKPSGDFVFSNADTNNDQKVNAADIVQISDLIKNPNINDISKSRSAANSDDQASYSQQHQYALYNYRNDGNFNAWLNLDIDSVTYSRIDTLGVERNAVVVQEVWTPDSLYRIPLEAIDSIGFRAPEPIMREGIFYLTEYHAAHTLEIDSLTLYFDTSIDRDRLPSLGQVVLHNTFTSPYEEGFAGRVKTIEKVNGRIKIDCEMLCVGDVYKHLVLVGSAKTMTDEEADVASARTRGYGDPWKKYEDNGEMPIRKIGDLTFNIFDGLISIVSKDPTLQVKYMVYVDEDIFQISANCQLTHNDLQYGLNLNKKKLSEIEDTIEVDKDLKEITQALTRLQNYKEMSAEEWAESILNEKKQKGDKEKLSDDEATVLGRLWEKLHGSWTIPIGGPFVLDLELGPLFKPKGSLELSFLAKTKARNTFYVEARGYTMATLANPKLALATGLAHIDGYSNFHSDPISSISVSAKAKASLSMGIIGKVSVSLIHKSIVHATVSGQGGLKLGGTIEAKWDSESWIDEDYSFNNFKDYFDPLYDMLKDTKIKAEFFANFGVELGLTPWSFLSVGAEWEVFKNELGSCYPFPHFSKPSFPVYYHDKEQWSNGNFNNHLVLQSSPTKNIPDLLLGPCNIGMRIIDEEGKTVRETEDREYRDDGTIVWQLFPLQIDLKGLEPGKSYRCYPILHYHDWYKLRATPSYEFTVPEPVSVKQSSLNIKKGDTKDITVFGGWGCYEIINDKNNIVTAYFSDEGEVTNSDDSNNMSEPGGGGGSDWGPPLIWTSSWPTDKTPTLQIKGIDVGEATVQVKDMRSNETTSIKVVVTDEEITPLELSSTLLTLEVGKKGTVTVSSGSGKYTAESSKSDVATVKVSKGKIQVTAIKAGSTTITVTDTETLLTASIKVTVTEESIDIPAEAIDLGLPSGTKWASYNVGATKPEDFGGYYAWGETGRKDTYDWTTYVHCKGTKESCKNLSIDITNTQYDVAHVKWGGNWRIPTKIEIQELLEHTDFEETSINGVKGCKYTGHNGNSIFLPYSGIYSEEGIKDKTKDVFIWSSSIDFNDISKAFQFNPELFHAAGFVLYNSDPTSVDRSQGLTVRPIYSTYMIVPQSFDLGEVHIGETKDVLFYITNTGSAAINVRVSCENIYLDISDNNVDCKIEKGQSKSYTIKCNGLYGGQSIDERIKVFIDNSKESYVNVCCKGRDAYAVFNEGTLTFYCDDNREKREGKTYDVQNNEHSIGWYRDDIKKVVFTPSFAEARPKSTTCWFSGFKSLTEINGINYLNTSDVTSMGWMFRGCTGLKSLDLSSFDTSKVGGMAGMFEGCSNLINLDVSHFNTSNATYLYGMFEGCSELSVLDVSNFNTSHAHEIAEMFMGCSKLEVLDLSNFDTSNVSYMDNMFYGCANLKTIYCGEKWTTENVLVSFDGMSGMFEGCTSLVGGKGTKYDSNHTDGEYARIDGGPYSPGYFTSVNAVTIKVEPQDIDFGTMTNGSSKTDYFIVYNTGRDNLVFHLEYSTLDGVFNVLEGGEETVLKPGESKKYTVTCTIPKDFKYSGGGVAIYVRSNASNDESIMVGLGVNVIHEEKEEIYVTPTEIDFGRVELDTDKTANFTVTNNKSTDVTFSVPYWGDYFEVSDTNEDITLAPGESKVFTITAHGMKRGGQASCEFRIKVNTEEDMEMPTIKATLTGWDTKPLTLATNSVSLSRGEEKKVEIVYGSLNYELTSDDPHLFIANIADHGRSGGGWYDNYSSTTCFVRIEAGTTAEKATIRVKDKDTGEEVALQVTIDP